MFLVDSGAEVSIVKPTATEKNAPSPGLNLVSVNGSPISTYGNRIMTLTFDDKTTFRWIFIIADVPHNILGIDFLRQNALVVVFANSSLNNSLSKISRSLVKQVCNVEIPKPFLVTNDYLKMLQSFPELTKPPNRDKPVKHDVVHEIETNGYPCHARRRGQQSPIISRRDNQLCGEEVHATINKIFYLV